MADSVSKSRLADRLEAARGILTSAAGVITALTALVVATGAFVHFWFPPGVSSNPATNDKCKPPYVWREATPDDHVCVDRELASKLFRTTVSLLPDVIQGAAVMALTPAYSVMSGETFSMVTTCA